MLSYFALNLLSVEYKGTSGECHRHQKSLKLYTEKILSKVYMQHHKRHDEFFLTFTIGLCNRFHMDIMAATFFHNSFCFTLQFTFRHRDCVLTFTVRWRQCGHLEGEIILHNFPLLSICHMFSKFICN